MRAVVLEEFGTPLVLREIEKPNVGPGQVLVKIKASGVNPLDTKIRAGKAAHAKRTLPAVLGLDLAGVVEEVGTGVNDFTPGDEVFGMTGGVGDLQGSLAEPTRPSTHVCSPTSRPRSPCARPQPCP